MLYTLFRLIPILILIFLFPQMVRAANPTFGGWSVPSDTSIEGCPTGYTCETIDSGDGFTQANVTDGTGTYVQTIITDSGATCDPSTCSFSDENFVSTDDPYWYELDATEGSSSNGATFEYFSSNSGTSTGISAAAVNDSSMQFNNTFDVSIEYPEVIVPATGDLTYVDLASLGSRSFGASLFFPTPNMYKLGPFMPGIHAITWLASNIDGDSSTVTQLLKITPMVTFGPDMTVGEGGTVTVPVYLNGPAHTYPVEIPYTVSGTAVNPDDHDASDGTIVISSGTMGTIEFNVVDDGKTGEADETVIFSLDTPVNAVPGIRTVQTVTITEQNLPPMVTLNVEQHDTATRTVAQDNGLVTVTADIHDPNPGDVVSMDWGNTDNSLLAIATADSNTLTFDPSGLTAGFYVLGISVTDNAEPAATTTTHLLIKVVPTMPVTAAQLGLSKSILLSQPSDDAQSVGWSVYWNPSQSGPEELSIAQGSALQTEPGLTLHLGDSAFAAGNNGTQVTLDEITEHGGVMGGLASHVYDAESVPDMIVDFDISGLTTPGQSVRVVIPQITPVPANAVYRKYLPDLGWVDFVIDDANTISAAPLINGICPSPGHTDYVAGLVAGYQCIQLMIEDGGPNDADGQANGIIKDPSGVAALPAPSFGPFKEEQPPPITTSSENDLAVPPESLPSPSVGGGAFDFGFIVVLLGYFFGTGFYKSSGRDKSCS